VLYEDGARSWLADRRLDELRPTLERQQVPPVASLVLAAKAAGLGLYIDIKSATTRALERLVELLEAESMAEWSILASVRSDLVATCAQVAPEIPRAVLFASTLEEPVQLAEAIGAHHVHPCWERLPRPDRVLAGPWLDRVRAHGLGVICWHEERPVVLEVLCGLGVDGICTDQPAVLAGIALRR
jgi:glycerophosphoryl diester phosphodiesterase